MANKLEWFFQERNPGEAKRGGNDNFAFQMSIDTLVRETIQNSNDQRIDKKVSVEFVIEEHSGSSSRNLLELIGWDNGLRQSLEAIAKGDSHLQRRAEKALEAAKGGKITSLTIRDYGARGLEGGEDSESGNFVMLCRHVLVTDATRKALRGGAFGIGKSVLWAFSGASVALFSSLPLEKGTKGKPDTVGSPRFFGRAYLVSHRVGSTDYNSDGHLGDPNITNGKEWAVSVRGTSATQLVAGSPLDRNWKDTGTSILIPFVSNPSAEGNVTAQSVVPQIVSAVQKWFWPSLVDGLLEVRVGTRVNGKESLATVQLPDWVKHFRSALAATSNEKIKDEDGTAKADLEVTLPRRDVDPKHAKLNGLVTLHIARLPEADVDKIPDDICNKVALVRGARMVVQYYDKSISPLVPPFVGVVKAGEYRSNAVQDSAVEAFFRDAEPPAHDRWEPTASKLKDNYAAGGQAEVRKFHETIGSKVKEILGGTPSGSGRTPRKLADLLRGGKGGIIPRTERFSMTKKTIDRSEEGTISASVRVERKVGKGSWTATLAVVLVDEQGTNRELPIVEFNEKALKSLGGNCTRNLGKDDVTVRSVSVDVPAGVDSIDVDLMASTAHSKVAERSLADVKAQYSQSNRGTK